MYYTPKIQKAVELATQVHQVDQDQKRKGKEIPYIIHPLAVALILARVGAGEEVVVAGILHDVIEDSVPSHRMTSDKIQQEFGPKVAQMVTSLTERDKTLPWAERKRWALEHIRHMDQDTLLVKSADFLHNLRDLMGDYERQGDKIFDFFNAPKAMQMERYRHLVAELEKVWPENPLLPEILEAFDRFSSISK